MTQGPWLRESDSQAVGDSGLKALDWKEAEKLCMQVNLQIPDDIARRIIAAGGDLSRRALEAFALEELRAGRITEPELAEMLGLGRLQLDGFLKSHGIFEEYTLEDFDHERQALKELGF